MSVPTSISVSTVEDRQVLRDLWEAADENGRRESWMLCGGAPTPHPPWDLLTRMADNTAEYLILGAWDQDRRPLCFAIVRRADGWEWMSACVPWADLLPPNDEEHSAFCQVGIRCVQEVGASWGHVEHPDLRAAMFATSPRAHGHGERIEFKDEPRPEWPDPPVAAKWLGPDHDPATRPPMPAAPVDLPVPGSSASGVCS